MSAGVPSLRIQEACTSGLTLELRIAYEHGIRAMLHTRKPLNIRSTNAHAPKITKSRAPVSCFHRGNLGLGFPPSFTRFSLDVITDLAYSLTPTLETSFRADESAEESQCSDSNLSPDHVVRGRAFLHRENLITSLADWSNSPRVTKTEEPIERLSSRCGG